MKGTELIFAQTQSYGRGFKVERLKHILLIINKSRQHLIIYISYFSQKVSYDIAFKLSLKEDNLNEI